jgi:hypothetical protein
MAQGKGEAEKQKQGGIYHYLMFPVFALLVSFHLLTGSYEFFAIRDNNYLWLSEPVFFYKLAALAAFFWALMQGLAYALGLEKDRAADKKMLAASAVLLAVDVIMSYFKYNDRALLCLYDFIFAAAIYLLFIRLRVFGNESGENGGNWRMKMLLSAAGVFVILAAARAFSFQDSFFTQAKDMGIFTNAIWRAGEDGTQSTFFEGGLDHRGVHFQPIIYLFAALFKLACMPHALLFMQALFSFGAAIFLYLLAGKALSNKNAAFLLALAFMASPYTARTFVYDYHFESMYMFMFLAFLYFAEERKILMSGVFLCLAVAIKEEAAAYMALAAVFAYLRTRDRKFLAMSAAAAAYGFIVIVFVIPAFNNGHGGFTQQILSGLPGGLQKIFLPDYIKQMLVFILGACLLPLAGAAQFLLLLLPPVIVHTLNYSPGALFLFDVQYASFTTPALFAGIVYGLAKAGRGAAGRMTGMAFFVYLLQGQAHLGFLPGTDLLYFGTFYALAGIFIITGFAGERIKPVLKYGIFSALAVLVFYAGYFSHFGDRSAYVPGPDKWKIRAAIKLVPTYRGSAVITNTNITPHMCCRKYIWAMELSKPEEIFSIIEKDSLDEFFLLLYEKDFTYNGLDPAAWTKEFLGMAEKAGFKKNVLQDDDTIFLLKFNK